ncbi:hypothetical protein MKEN_00469300 [Mycena kentingensis (nom. inval.)]|nr:hypothetical protein MKEN_00469300 [Mycena kentingensis (nom. inval.)]
MPVEPSRTYAVEFTSSPGYDPSSISSLRTIKYNYSGNPRRTCKHLHGLAFQKIVWIALCARLQQANFLDTTSTPPLADLSTDQLIDLVKALVQGPRSWAARPNGPVPIVQRSIQLPVNVDLTALHLYWGNEAELLPSGTHLLFNNLGTLELWDMNQIRRVWTNVLVVALAEVVHFASEQVGQQGCPFMEDRVNYVEIIDLNLRTLAANTLLVSRLSQGGVDNPFEQGAVCGDFATVKFNAPTRFADKHDIAVFSLQIPAQPRVLRVTHDFHGNIALADGYLLVSPPGSGQVQIIALDGLGLLWGMPLPPSGSSNPPRYDLSDLPLFFSFPIDTTRRVLGGFLLMKSPLRENQYRIWVQTDCLPSHQLTLTPGDQTPPIVRPRATDAVYPADSHLHPTYSGHALIQSWDTGPRHIVPPAAPAGGRNLTPSGIVHAGGHQVDAVTSYSGAVVSSSRSAQGRVVVRYYA